MFIQASETSFPYQNKGKFHIDICPQTHSYLGTVQQCVDIKSLRFFLLDV